MKMLFLIAVIIKITSILMRILRDYSIKYLSLLQLKMGDKYKVFNSSQ